MSNGDLHIRDVGTEDSHKPLRCTTYNTLTNDTRTSTQAMLYVIGNNCASVPIYQYLSQLELGQEFSLVTRADQNHCPGETLICGDRTLMLPSLCIDLSTAAYTYTASADPAMRGARRVKGAICR